MKIYISLPISGREKEAREQADKIKQAIRNAGHEPISPFDVTIVKKKPNYFDHICADLRVMLDCDAICFSEHWITSCGCQIEFDVARILINHWKKKFIAYYCYDDGKLVQLINIRQAQELDLPF